MTLIKKLKDLGRKVAASGEPPASGKEVRFYECPKGCALGMQRHFGVPPETPRCLQCGTLLRLTRATTTDELLKEAARGRPPKP